MNDLIPCNEDLNILCREQGYGFKAGVINNNDFDEPVLNPILIATDRIADTNELLTQSYQLIKMFGDVQATSKKARESQAVKVTGDSLSKFKVEKITRIFLRDAPEKG